MLSIPNQLEGAYLGQEVILECHTEAYPASINYWTTERGDMIISGNLSNYKCKFKKHFQSFSLISVEDTSRAGDKFETISTNSGYSKYMKLKIRNIGPNDFGSYRCVAKNSLGETDGMIKLDGNVESLLKFCFNLIKQLILFPLEIATPTTLVTTELTLYNRNKSM